MRRCCHEKLTNSNCRDSAGFGDQMQFRHLVEMWLVAFQATLTILLQLWENIKIWRDKITNLFHGQNCKTISHVQFKKKLNKFGLINYSSFPDHFEFIGKLPDFFYNFNTFWTV